MAKQILYHEAARRAILKGIDALADAVKVTLGPRGRNVLIEKKFGPPLIINDGVTVAKEIDLREPNENMGAQAVKEVASKTGDEAGDGTTTATLLAQAIYREGVKVIAAGANQAALKRGIDAAVKAAVAQLAGMAKPIQGRQETSQVATIAANNDEKIGELIAEAIEKVGKDGAITIEEAKTMETRLEIVEGLQFDQGYLSPYFITDADRMEAGFEDAYLLSCEKKIATIQELLPLLEAVTQQGKPLLVIAEDVEGEVLATLVVNKLRGTLRCCAVKAPGYGDRRKALLEDIATVTGGKAVTEDLGIKLEKLRLEDLGRAKRVVVDKENTTIVGGGGASAAIQMRIQQIKKQIQESKSDYDREKLEERLAKLSGGVAVVHVGAATEMEMKEKKSRIDDAMHATRAAAAEGVVPGGGVALLRCAAALDKLEVKDDEEKMGVRIVQRALEEPIRVLTENAGFESSVIVQRIRAEESRAFGFNAATGQFEDLLVSGILDPVKVTRSALQNAASIAGLLLNTEAVVTEIPEKERPPASFSAGETY